MQPTFVHGGHPEKTTETQVLAWDALDVEVTQDLPLALTQPQVLTQVSTQPVPKQPQVLTCHYGELAV